VSKIDPSGHARTESSETADKIAELKARARDYGTGSIQAEIARLERKQVAEAERALVDEARLSQDLADKQAWLEGAYAIYWLKADELAQIGEQIAAARGPYARAWADAKQGGLDVPKRIEKIDAQAAADYEKKTLLRRLQSVVNTFGV
jgi:hypothetical protein